MGSSGRPPKHQPFANSSLTTSVRSKRNVSSKTARDYRYAVDCHLLPRLGAFRLTDITSGVLNQFGARLKTAGYAGATVNNYMYLAALLLGYAVEFDVIEDLPLKKKLKKQKANKPCLELNAEERANVLAAFDDIAGFRRHLAETMPKPKAAGQRRAVRRASSLRRRYARR